MAKMAQGFALTAQACRRTRSLSSSATSARSIPANYDIVVVGLVLSYILYVTHFHVGIFVITSPLGSGLFLSVQSGNRWLCVCARDRGSVFVCMYMSEKYTYARKREKGIDPLISFKYPPLYCADVRENRGGHRRTCHSTRSAAPISVPSPSLTRKGRQGLICDCLCFKCNPPFSSEKYTGYTVVC